MANKEQIRELVKAPKEALQIELKTWFDPSTDDGIAKLIKAIFALRNRNGGFLLIGFNNASHLPDPYPLSEPVEALFHPDKIQYQVSRFSSLPFEVEVVLEERDGQKQVVISVPEGVRSPAVVKRVLTGEGGKTHLAEGDLYFRTLSSNGTASSARIKPADYGDLLEICFDNREADIGRFLRRHLPGNNFADTVAVLAGGQGGQNPLKRRTMEIIEKGSQASVTAIAEATTLAERERIKNALTMRVGLALDPGKPDELPTQTFLNKVAASNPNLTGWPIWLDSRGASQKESQPHVIDGAWQALIVSLDGGWSEHLDFQRFDPRGNFYLQRVMQDDLTEKVEPGTALDVVLMIYRVAEALVVGTNYGPSLGWDEAGNAGFAFRWDGLMNRSLRPWVNAFHGMGTTGNQSRTQFAEAYVEVPLETPSSALAPYVARAVAPLFAVFDGYTPPSDLIEVSVRKLVERKMD